MVCLYYRATVTRSEAWFLVAVLRSFEHLAFDRTYDKTLSVFEFFVPEHNEKVFLELMQYFVVAGVVTEYEQLSNRLLAIDAEL